MAPLCVINAIGATSVKRLSELTGLDEPSAKNVSVLAKQDQNKPLTQLEKQLLAQFDGYIKVNRDVKSPQNTDLRHAAGGRFLPLIHVALALVMIVVIVGLSIQIRKNQTPASVPVSTETQTPSFVPQDITSSAAPNPDKTETATPQNADAETPKSGQTVWKAKTGDVYHTDPNCCHIPKSATQMDLRYRRRIPKM